MDVCKRCGSYAINHRLHGRDGSDPDLCDVCYWRKRVDTQNERCYNIQTNGEETMIASNNKAARKTTRYAVIARSTGRIMKNAATREIAREWKRESGKNGLGILDRNTGSLVS